LAAAPIAPVKPVIEISPGLRGRFRALPERFDLPSGPPSEALVSLGRMLYFDARWSGAQNLSCNGCHDLARQGIDGAKHPNGEGKSPARNTPSVYNVGGYGSFGWDGRSTRLEEFLSSHRIGPDDRGLAAALKAAGYSSLFLAAFPSEKNPLSAAGVAQALGAFLRGLNAPSRFDRFLAGEAQALSESEKAGMVAFEKLGCLECHQGVAVGAGHFARLGKKHPYVSKEDPGRFALTQKESDRGVFRVASLRNVEKTGPYLHDGMIGNLRGCIENMAWMQSSMMLGDEDLASLVSFLGSLTGTPPAAYLVQPELPSAER
jgi:cytochrome c peroxidase